MKKLLTFLLVMMCLQTMAQRPTVVVKPTSAQMEEQRKNAEKLKEVIRLQAEKQAAIDEILKKRVTMVNFEILNIPYKIPSTDNMFTNRSVKLKGNKGIFLETSVEGKGKRSNAVYRSDAKKYDFNESYSYIPQKETTYEDLLNGIEINIDFTNRMFVYGDLDYSSEFRVTVRFSEYDGVPCTVYPTASKNIFIFTVPKGEDLHISRKIGEDYFRYPDPKPKKKSPNSPFDAPKSPF